MSEKLGDDRQSLACGDRRRSERVTQVMNANILQAGAGAHTLPKWLKVVERRTRQCPNNDPWVALDACDSLEHVHTRLAEVNDLRSCLGIWKTKRPTVAIDVPPL